MESVCRRVRRFAIPTRLHSSTTTKGLRDRFQPHFGFTLHDQNARTHAGHGGPQSAIALLPPAYDEAKSYNQVRARARLVAATLARIFAYAIPGRIAKYDDTYNPGAFGDLMQEWGTGTVLIESGARLPALQRRRRKRPPHPRRAPGDPRSLRPKQ